MLSLTRFSTLLLVLGSCVLFSAWSSSAFAQEKAASRQSANVQGDRKQKLDFEDETIEGLNKKPYDHLSQVSERNKKGHDSHLYWKRTHFNPETSETIRELRFVQ